MADAHVYVKARKPAKFHKTTTIDVGGVADTSVGDGNSNSGKTSETIYTYSYQERKPAKN